MKGRRQGLGRMGEELARRHLVAAGYSVLEANYRGKTGEIDLIVRKDGTIVFVEVRTKRGGAYGTPEESITASKRARLVTAAEGVEWRIDLVAVDLDLAGRLIRVDTIKHAVEL